MPLAIFATLSFKPKPNVIPAAPNAANREEMWKPKGVSAIINAKILNMYLQKEDKKVITLFSTPILARPFFTNMIISLTAHQPTTKITIASRSFGVTSASQFKKLLHI